MFKNVYFAKITSYGPDGYPVVGEFVPMYDVGITNTSLTFQKTTTRKDYEADDAGESSNEVVTGYKLTTKALGISATCKALIEDLVTDTNGNLVCREKGEDDPSFVMFFQARNEKGDAYQKWCYKVHVTKSNTENANQKSAEQDISYDIIGSPITNAEGKYVFYSDVLSGKTGWITGAPTNATIYKEVTA